MCFYLVCLQDDDDELFSVKKAEARKVRKVVKPLGDDDLFGDSGDIFSDIPSKPKGTKKKKSATTAPKDDIFAEDATVAGLSCCLFVLFYFWVVCFEDIGKGKSDWLEGGGEFHSL